MIHFKRVKISDKRPYVIRLSWEEIDTIIQHLPKNEKKPFRIVLRLRRLIYDEYKNK